MTINDRFDIIIKKLYSGNKSAFAKDVCVSPTVIENVVGKRQGKPSYDLLKKVFANANVSTEWLFNGKGSMLREEPTPVKKTYPVNDSEQHTAGGSMLREEPITYQANEFYKELYEKEREKSEELLMKIGKMGNEIETLQKNYKALRKKNDICLKEEHHLQIENFTSDLDVDCFEQEVPLKHASIADAHYAKKTRNPHIEK
jgi:hypothetical protein